MYDDDTLPTDTSKIPFSTLLGLITRRTVAAQKSSSGLRTELTTRFLAHSGNGISRSIPW
jgi:hypothetical protein